MRVLSTLALLTLVTLGATGCSFATTSVAGNSNVDGEAWYVRTTGIFFLVFSTKVYYCPPPRKTGPVTCKEAKMNDEGGDTEMPLPKSSDDHGNAEPSDNGNAEPSDNGGEAKPSKKKHQDQDDQEDQEDQEDN